MLVDDAVVVVEGIYYRMQRGMDSLQASLESLNEVAQPVTTAVLTTISAFLPLMLLPGILGKFMMLVPLVVSVALLLSLVESFWMLPAHVVAMGGNMSKPGRVQQWRTAAMRWLRHRYAVMLIRVLRWPKLTLGIVISLFLFSGSLLAPGVNLIKVDFFAADTLRIFYVNVEMPATSTLQTTLNKVLEVEEQVKKHLNTGEARSVVSYAGQMFTEIEPYFGTRYGQIVIGLNPETKNSRRVEDIVAGMREDVVAVRGANISFLVLSSGPPTNKAISVKVRGNDFQIIRRASQDLQKILVEMGGIKDVSDNASEGRMELTLKLNHDAIRRAGINPAVITRTIRLLVDGEVVADMQDQGEKLEIRLLPVEQHSYDLNDVGSILDFHIPTPSGASIPLSELTTQSRVKSVGTIRHHNFLRAITVEADLVKQEHEDFGNAELSQCLVANKRIIVNARWIR